MLIPHPSYFLSSFPPLIGATNTNPPPTDPNPDDFERHKQDSLQKQKNGKGHWKPELASASEESIKADRMSPHEAGEAALKRLQEQTKGHAEETAKHGTSMKDNM